MAKQTITALYDSRGYATNAVLQLQQVGTPQGDFLSQLSQHLPATVYDMKSDGWLPDESPVSV